MAEHNQTTLKPPPGVDRDHIKAFVGMLFKHATGRHWVSLRAFFEDGAGRPPFKIEPIKLNGSLDAFEALVDQAYLIAKLAASAQDKIVFCPPIATFTNAKHAREKDLAEGLTLSVECDAHAQTARIKLEALLGPATVVVASGGRWNNPETGKAELKLHLHFRLKRPARAKDEQEKLKKARKLATRIVGGDPSNVPLVHPIRWPGSVHRKAEPKLCRIIDCDEDAEIDLDAALEILQKAVGNGHDDTGTSAAQFDKIPVTEAFRHLDPNQRLGEGIEVRKVPPPPLPPIEAECPWLKHVHDTGGRDQSEPLWKLAHNCCVFLEDGERLIHEFSNQHPGYNPEDTEAKFDRACRDQREKDLGWPLCRTIREHGSEQCKGCPHREKGKSPLHLAPHAIEPPPTPTTWDPAEIRVSFADIPHRQWIYGNYLVRGEITVMGAPGGVGKTALITGMAIELAAGKELLEERIWGSDLKVLLINGEDGTVEIDRRMWGFSRAHANLIGGQTLDRLYAVGADDPRVQGLSFLRTERNVSSLDIEGFKALKSALDAIRPDVLMLDPLVAFCGGGNMNDNAAMSLVMRGLKSLAAEFGCAVLIVHHTKKGGEQGDVEAVSGAAAIVNLARRAIMPVPMTNEDASSFGVLPSERFRYFKLVDAKSNFAPRSADSPWYALHSIELPNAEPPIYPNGDNVQAVIRVTMPLPKTTAEAADDQKIQRAILDLVGRGKLIGGEQHPYSPNVSGARNQRALLDDAMAAVKEATVPKQWPPGDLRAVVHAVIDKMKKEGWLYEEDIKKGRFRQGLALCVNWQHTPWPNSASPVNDGTAPDGKTGGNTGSE
jgi:hypothetical protein